jgi:DNA-directed RNA polymerase subunit beta
MRKILLGKVTVARLVDDKGKVLIAKDVKIDTATIEEVPVRYWHEIQVEAGNTEVRVEEQLEQLAMQRDDDVYAIETQYSEKIAKLTKGDELPPGVIKLVKVYLAIKRRMSVGDKMAGRHGNKGVVSRLLPEEDMPYLPDGTPVDIVLNPLGVPSRMNVGQILETHLGWAAREIGRQIDQYLESEWSADVLRNQMKKVFPDKKDNDFLERLNDEEVGLYAHKLRRGVHMATPVFDGASEVEIKESLTMVGLPTVG